ncbi:MAG: hypothetical protein JRC93_11130, partial [Deltaproteobacteria bacterium]|nr:hypothetical protein [Deltaproteobacteria bacterium]
YGFRFAINPKSDVEKTDTELRVCILMTPDLKKYFSLHGVKIERDVLVIPREKCTITKDLIAVDDMCCRELRDDYLCPLHPDGKPEGCKNVSWETALAGDCEITPKCLFTYKLKGLEELP